MDDDSKENAKDLAGSEPSDANGERTGPTTERFCPHCETNVEPVRKGQCPKCGVFLPSNQVARRHIADEKRRDQLLAEIIAEYQPSTLEQRDACRLLADTKEAFERSKAGTTERQRLVAEWSDLTSKLRVTSTITSNPHLATAAAALAPLDNDQQIEFAIERVERSVKMLRLLQRAKADDDDPPASPAADHTDSSLTSELNSEVPFADPTSESTPEPARCPHCARLQTECDALRQSDPEFWAVICSRHPDVIKAKDDRATAEMYESLRRARMGGDPNVR